MQLKKLALLFGVILALFVSFILISKSKKQEQPAPQTSPSSQSGAFPSAPKKDGKPAEVPPELKKAYKPGKLSEDPLVKGLDVETAKLEMWNDQPEKWKNFDHGRCEKEFYKAALIVRSLGRVIGFGSLDYCFNKILKLNENQVIERFKLLTAVSKKDLSYNLDGKNIDLSEENLKKLSQ